MFCTRTHTNIHTQAMSQRCNRLCHLQQVIIDHMSVQDPSLAAMGTRELQQVLIDSVEAVMKIRRELWMRRLDLPPLLTDYPKASPSYLAVRSKEEFEQLQCDTVVKIMKLRNEALEGWVRPKTPPPSPVRWLRSGRRRPEEDRPEEDG